MSQRARAYRRQARTDRYGSGAYAHQQDSRPNHYGELHESRSAEDWNRCPHCGTPGLDLMHTAAELVEVAELHGMKVALGPVAGVLEQTRFWFCHHCANGGVIGMMAGQN